VAHNTWKMTYALEGFEQGVSPSPSARGTHNNVSAKAMGSVATGKEEYAVVKKHFIKHMNHAMVYCDDPLHREISRFLNDDLTKFPLWKYLKFNVRSGVAQLFRFGWAMWLPVIGLFVALMLLHRFAHMGYIRIMGFFATLTLAIIISMGFYVKSITQEIQRDEDPEPGPPKKSIHTEYPTECITLGLLQFAMFFVCYGVARMICQPWMWELHFWPVFCLTVVAVFSAVLFVWLVAPAIPSFCALQAIPPYVDADNLEQMRHIAEMMSKGESTGMTPRPPAQV